VDYILAIQKKLCPQGWKVPLAIMTSDDTKTLTEELLHRNNLFGLDASQLTIMKQEKVPAMLDNDARFALEGTRLLLETKPHGHGDVHTLLYQHNLTKQWSEQGIKWVVFFQDTNPLIFRSVIPVVGVSSEQDFEMNTVGIRRKPEEPVGAITKLVHKDGRNLVINV
jgi:UDP-sugar pyrophosphorylase